MSGKAGQTSLLALTGEPERAASRHGLEHAGRDARGRRKANKRPPPKDPPQDGRGHHPNSQAAYGSEAPRLCRRHIEIMREIAAGGPGTDREIADRMGFAHKSAVQPRISEMIKAKELEELTSERFTGTGCRNRVVGLTEKGKRTIAE